MKNYELKLNPRQAKVVVAALDVLTRIGMGQLEIVAEHVHEPMIPDEAMNAQRRRQLASKAIRQRMIEAKVLLGHHPKGSYGIGHSNTTEESKIAYDLECVLRRAIAKAENHDANSVWHHDPMHYGPEPLATVEVSDGIHPQSPLGNFFGQLQDKETPGSRDWG